MSMLPVGFTFVPCGMCGVFGDKSLRQVYCQSVGKHLPVFGVGVMTGSHMALFDKQRHAFHLCCGILAGGLFVIVAHQSPQFARLGIVVVIVLPFVIIEDRTVDFHWRLFELWVVMPLAKAVRLICYGVAIVVVSAHLSVAMI